MINVTSVIFFCKLTLLDQMYQITKCPTEIFFIRYEHKFLRNLYSKEQLESSPEIKTLKGYYKTFKKFIKICVSLQSVLVSHVNFNDSDDHDHELQDFLQNNCAGYNLEDLRNEIYLLDSNILMTTPSINSMKDYIFNSNWK